jgi:hypothetical protein
MVYDVANLKILTQMFKYLISFKNDKIILKNKIVGGF